MKMKNSCIYRTFSNNQDKMIEVNFGHFNWNEQKRDQICCFFFKYKEPEVILIFISLNAKCNKVIGRSGNWMYFIFWFIYSIYYIGYSISASWAMKTAATICKMDMDPVYNGNCCVHFKWDVLRPEVYIWLARHCNTLVDYCVFSRKASSHMLYEG